MRSPLAFCVIVLLALGVAGCGSAHQNSPTTSRVAIPDGAAITTSALAEAPGSVTGRPYLNDGDKDPYTDEDPDDRNGHKVDEDNDSPEDHMRPENTLYHDQDDERFVDAGRAASTAEVRNFAPIVKRYYAVAAAENGAAACSMMYSRVAETVVEDYGQAPGPLYMRGKTCQAVMTKFFKHVRSRVSQTFVVTGARIISGNEALLLLGSKTMPASQISVKREHGVWKINGLLGGPFG